jgi:predicted nucleotidyltransferase
MATDANPKIWTRDEALAVLRELLPDLKARYGVTRIGIFGSVARNEAAAGSDLDVVVRMREPDLFAMGSILAMLEERFDCRIDLIRWRESAEQAQIPDTRAEAVYCDE